MNASKARQTGRQADPDPVEVVLADDFGAMLHRLRSFLETLGRFVVVAAAENGHDAWQAILELRPRVALLDLQMPGLTGLEVAARVRAGQLATRVVILSLHDGPEVRAYCVAAGADGFVSKHRLTTELPSELRRLVGIPLTPYEH
jgi:DNA-binding NarL/FixJ family response regulator